MKQLVTFLFLSLLIAAGCTNNNSTGKRIKNRTVPVTSSDTDDTPGDWYMRLNGTLAGKPIVVNLHKYGALVGGYYQYTGIGTPIKLQNIEDSTRNDGQHYLTEINNDPDAGQRSPHWSFTVVADGISGKWIGKDGTTVYDLSLKEGYPQGSIPMSAFDYTDTAQMWKTKPEPTANVAYGIVWPETGDKSAAAAFLHSEIAGGMQLEASVGAFTALKTRAWRYFGNYRLDIAKVLDSNAKEEELKSFTYKYSTTFYHYIVYNDHNWLILESNISNYTGGAHGMYGATYLNLDFAGTRAWKLNDIIMDTTALRPLLGTAAQAHFHMNDGEPLDKRLLVAEIPVTFNFYLNASGLTFVYNPYDIASYADGVIELFVPYNKLMPLLTPDFKKRADLGEQSGAL